MASQPSDFAQAPGRNPVRPPKFHGFSGHGILIALAMSVAIWAVLLKILF